MQSKIGNKAKGRQHSRHAGKRAAAKLRRNQRANARKIKRERRLVKGSAFRYSSKGETPSDLRRRERRRKEGKTK